MSRISTKKLVGRIALMGMMTAMLIVLGYVNIPMPAGLSITFNMIPVALAAIALEFPGGAAMGGVFGMISFLQCFGIFGFSAMGAALVNVSPVLMFVQRFVSRVLVGVLTALIYHELKKVRMPVYAKCAITGFSSAFLNTLLFMLTLVLIFGQTDYMQKAMAGRSVLAYIIASVGINAVVEMFVASVVTGGVGTALIKAKLI